MNSRPIVWIAVCWAAGMASIGQSVMAYGIIAAGLALLLAAAVLAERSGRLLAAVCLVVYIAGGGWAQWTESRFASSLPDLAAAADGTYPPITFEAEAQGTIVSSIAIDGDSVRFRMQVSAIRLKDEAADRQVHETVLVQLKLLDEAELSMVRQWQRGYRLHAAGSLERPVGPSNAGGFDYRNYLQRTSHIHWVLRMKGAESVQTERSAAFSIHSALGAIDAVRDWLGSRMDQLYKADQSGYMKGLVLGSSEELDPDVFLQFAELGLTHILAISGLHVAVFLYVIHAVLRMLRLSREKTLLILAGATPFYVLLSGASPSVIRAGIMAVIGLLAARANRLKDGLHLLAASAIAMLAWDPSYLYNIGFQLSYIVTLGLVVGVKPIRSLMPQWRRGKQALDLMAVTITAQLVSFPITIYYFNQWNPLSIPANFVFVPFISFIVMPLGAASLVLQTAWPTLGQWLASLTEAVNHLTFATVQSIAEQRGWQTAWAKPAIGLVAAWYGLLGLGIYIVSRLYVHRGGDAFLSDSAAAAGGEATIPLDDGLRQLAAADRRRLLRGLGGVVLAAAMLLLYAWSPNALNRTAKVSILDIGQGDSILIRTGGGKHILIDGGGTLNFSNEQEAWRERNDPFEVGRKVLVPLLKQRGVHSIDLLVVSHLDSDHIGGLQAVLESVPIKRIWWNGTIKDSEDARSLLASALKLHIPMIKAAAGMSWQPEADTMLDVLWPAASNQQVAHQEDQNESSVTVLLTLYGRTFLFPGDIGQETEHKLLEGLIASCGEGSGSCLDVLKVGHHGSKGSTSSAWLAYWKPAYAVISAGKDNAYRHPHPDTLARMAAAGIGVLRTDRDGEVAFAVKPSGEMNIGWSRNKWMKQAG